MLPFVVAAAAAASTEETGWGRCAADNQCVGVSRFNGLIRAPQQVRVAGRADAAGRPLAVDVGFIPYFDGVGSGGCNGPCPVGEFAQIGFAASSDINWIWSSR